MGERAEKFVLDAIRLLRLTIKFDPVQREAVTACKVLYDDPARAGEPGDVCRAQRKRCC